MLVYVAHMYSNKRSNIRKAKKITHDLAIADPFNTYVCPLLTFMYLRYGEVGYDDEMSMCQDLLGECGEMIVASPISKGVQIEIDYCKEWGIPITFLNLVGVKHNGWNDTNVAGRESDGGVPENL